MWNVVLVCALVANGAALRLQSRGDGCGEEREEPLNIASEESFSEDPWNGTSEDPLNRTGKDSLNGTLEDPLVDDPDKPLILQPRDLIRVDKPLPPVAAIIAIHPPNFPFLVDFMLQYWTCPAAREAMDVWPVFGSNSDHQGFVEAFCSKCKDYNVSEGPLDDAMADSCIDMCANWDREAFLLPWKPLRVQMHRYGSKKLASWKKIDGVAQLLELDKTELGTYEFALMMDSEMAITDCAGFAHLADSLRKKHEAKVWYGDVSETVCDTEGKMKGAARSIADRNSSDYEYMAKASKNWAVYLWWNDVPYVHMETAREMFVHWGKVLQAWQGRPELPSPKVVSKNMGEINGHSQLNWAAQAFEHMIYQLYTVLRKGWTIEDLTPKLEHHSGLSLGERACWLSEADAQAYSAAVQPLWQRGGCDMVTAPSVDPPLMAFHLDRVQEIKERLREW